MSVVMLLIARENGEHISIHDDDRGALAALVEYVDTHWADAQFSQEVPHSNPDLRIDKWFEATRSFYFISEVFIKI